ncbi:MAG TPA: pyruvate kinase alpha/beta domain-containing protein, partial [Nakamurella sp.]
IRNQLALTWGVHTLVTPAVDTIDELFDQVDQAVLALPGYEVNDMVVVVAGSSSRSTARTSLIRVHRLGHRG